MKNLLISILCLWSFGALAFGESTGNICTVALFEKSYDIQKNLVPGKSLGVQAVYNTNGTAGVYGKLHNVSEMRAVIYRGVISMDGTFRAQFDEVNVDEDGNVTFRDAVTLSEEKVFYSPYPNVPAENKATLVVMDNYLATVSCVVF